MDRAVCVSIPTDDEETVKLGHFGDARLYLHFVYVPGEGWRLARRVENPYTGHHHHHHHHHGHHGHGRGEEGKRAKIVALQEGCTAIVAVAFGPGGEEYMERRGLRVVKVPPRASIEDALRAAEEALGLQGGGQG